jgi:hypothetical protein
MLGDKWKALTETERKPYDEKAATDKKRYEEEKAKYQAVSCSTTNTNTGSPTNTKSRVRMTRRRSLPKRLAANLDCAAGVCVYFR